MSQQAATGAALDRFPLSYPQDDWCRNDDFGTFDPRFIQVMALRVTGSIDVAALQAALDALVVRHEILRTVVIRGEDRHQQVHPPCPVPLAVHDLVADPARTRDEIAEGLRVKAHQGTLDVRDLPVLRVVLHRFDDRDSVLVLTTHHSAGDGWSTQVLLRDLAVLYKANVHGETPALPPVRQYHEYAQWQQERLGARSTAMDYWRDHMSGAKVFALPTDRPDRRVYESDYLAHGFLLDASVGSTVDLIAKSTRSSVFVVLLAGMNILAHQIAGETDIVINTLTAGRSERTFRNTAGLFLNFLAMRTDLAGCTTFRDVIASTRKTCFAAYSNEIPIQVVENLHPELMKPIEEPTKSDFILTYTRPVFSADEFVFADGARPVPTPRDLSEHIPGSTVWGMALQPSGEIEGQLQFNPDIFDEATITGWVCAYRRLLERLIEDPDQPWLNH